MMLVHRNRAQAQALVILNTDEQATQSYQADIAHGLQRSRAQTNAKGRTSDG
jgi:hypothetical protein